MAAKSPLQLAFDINWHLTNQFCPTQPVAPFGTIPHETERPPATKVEGSVTIL
jgi:hypothetical protein